MFFNGLGEMSGCSPVSNRQVYCTKENTLKLPSLIALLLEMVHSLHERHEGRQLVGGLQDKAYNFI